MSLVVFCSTLMSFNFKNYKKTPEEVKKKKRNPTQTGKIGYPIGVHKLLTLTPFAITESSTYLRIQS